MKNIDFKKYSRFFAFGCSFTAYYWPTWANIIAKEIPDHYIYAKSGAGNFYIFQALMEAQIHHSINKNDLVMIMFSNITREDRFTRNRGWITPGNLYFQDEYDNKFLKNYLCHHGYLMRDLNLVQGCRSTLDNIGCDYELMSMVPFDSESSDGKKIDNVEYLFKFYQNTLSILKPSVMEIIFNNDWESRPIRPIYSVSWQKEKYRDMHPTPAEHFLYLQKIYPNIQFSAETHDWVELTNDVVLSSNFDPNQMQWLYKKNVYHRLGEDARYE